MTRPTIIAGNWKQNPSRLEGERLYQEIRAGVAVRQLPPHIEVVLFPPFPYLAAFEADARVRLGAQDLSPEPWGALTGEVGAPLLREFGASHAIVGHSERRTLFGETDDLAARKVAAAAQHGLVPILCIGETKLERDRGETFGVLERQLLSVLAAIGDDAPLVVAYEPVWAIGTGRTATPELAAEAHRRIRAVLAERWPAARSARVPIIYGGSVTPENAAGLFARPEIDGALVGGASRESAALLAIVDAALARRQGGTR